MSTKNTIGVIDHTSAPKRQFEKRCVLPTELIPELEKRGLKIENKEKAINYLTHIGYFRLSAYLRPLYTEPSPNNTGEKRDHVYKDGATFEKALKLYRFDRKLRLLVFNEIEKIEVAVRSVLSNDVSDYYKNIFWITSKDIYRNIDKYNDSVSRIGDAISKSKEDFLSHHKKTYNTTYPPAWIIVEILPFGTLSQIFKNLKNTAVQKRVSNQFGLNSSDVFTSWFEVLINLRNMCCHHSRMWNRVINIEPALPHDMKDFIVLKNADGSDRLNKHRMYIRLVIIKYLLKKVSPYNTFTDKLKKILDDYKPIDMKAMGFPDDWESDPIWQTNSE